MTREEKTVSASDTVWLDGASLDFDQVLAVARGRPGAPRVALTDAARAAVQRAADGVQRLLREGRIAYGITTGFGAFKDRVIPPDQVEQLQRNILVSHAVGVGRPYDVATTRAIMLIRANTLARGNSGVRVETLELLLALPDYRHLAYRFGGNPVARVVKKGLVVL